MPRQVTAFSNATVKRLRSLRDKKGRRAEGLFLAEGLRILTEARDSGRLPEIVAFSSQGAEHPLAAEIIAATEAAGGEAIETSADILAKMSGKDNPQLLLGAYRVPDTSLDRIDRDQAPHLDRRPGAARPRQYRDHPEDRRRGRRGRADPGRRQRRPVLGRSGAGLDGRGLHPGHRRRALARIRRLAAERRRPAGRHQPQGDATIISRPNIAAPCFLLIGNEQQGLPADYEAECDLLVKIPMAGRADSLNAAMAAAVMAFAVKASWR